MSKSGISPDVGQIGVEWLPLAELLKLQALSNKNEKEFNRLFNGEKMPTYLGDIN